MKSPSALDRALALAVALVCVAALAWVQSGFPFLWDGDSYFHVRAAQQLGEHGVEKQFRQTVYSTWSERYSDKDLLFHVALIPFVGTGDLMARGKWAAICFDSLVLLAMLFALHALGIRFGALWIGLLLSSHPDFVTYLLAVRPQLLSNTLLFIEMALLLRGRAVLLGAVAAVHVLSHSSFILLPAFAVAQIAAQAWRREALPWRPLVAVTIGIGLASGLHPYFPNNLTMAFDQIVEVARNVWFWRTGVPRDLFGAELLPLATSSLLMSFPGWLPGFVGLVVARRRGGPALSSAALTLAFASAGLLLLSLLSARFFPLFLSLSTLLAGRLWTELAGPRSLGDVWGTGRGRAAVALLAACLLAGQFGANVVGVRRWVRGVVNEAAFAGAADFLRRSASAEDVVYHNFWWDFSGLYYHRPEGRYIVALDPIFLYRADPARFRSMLLAYRGQAPDLHAIIAGEFGARWIFFTRLKRNERFYAAIRTAPHIRRRYEDRYTFIYEVEEIP